MKNAILILGGNALNVGVADIFRQLGYKIVVVDFRSRIGFGADMHLRLDATDPNVAHTVQAECNFEIQGVYTSMDDAVLTQKNICKAYGLLCAHDDALKSAHSKELMHKKWLDAGLLGRKSIALGVYRKKEFEQLSKKSTTIIIKPVDSCASRGISILPSNATEKELKNAFNMAQRASKAGVVNIEEFVEGQEYTVEMLGDNYGNIAIYGISKKYHTNYTVNNKIAIKLHYNSTDIPVYVRKELAAFGQKCYSTLGLRNTFGHLEVIRKPNGELSPVELGARSSGFIASHLAGAASGHNYLKDFIEVQHGATVNDCLLAQGNVSAMYFFYDVPPNICSKKETNLMNYINPEITSVYYDRSTLLAGTVFKELCQDTDRYGYEILVGPATALTIAEVEKAENAFLKDFFSESA